MTVILTLLIAVGVNGSGVPLNCWFVLTPPVFVPSADCIV